MKILALDISTKTGWAVILTKDHMLLHPTTNHTVSFYGRIEAGKTVKEWGKYPFSYLQIADHMAQHMCELVQNHKPDIIIIEETNIARSRYSQKVLEFIHCKLLDRLAPTIYANSVVYVNTSDWRRILDIYLSKQDKKNNAKVNRARRQGKSKKELGLKGKITKKHIAIRWVWDHFQIKLLQKDNDIAEAICLGIAATNPKITYCNGQ